MENHLLENVVKRQPSTAMDFFSKNLENYKIISMCQQFDEMLGGGFPCGKLTEICGYAGIGKTQLCFQACISVQIPECLGGINGEAIYIDTEGSFSTERLILIARYTITHCQKIAKLMKLSNEELRQVENLDELKMLKSIFYFRCTDQSQLLCLTYRLHNFCLSHPKVRLIVIDSIAFHFRYDSIDIPQRNRILTVLGQNLSNIANQFGISVLLTNQMTTKFIEGAGYAAPALGESWGHICHIRIQLQNNFTNNSVSRRQAVLLKHNSQPFSSSLYQITVRLMTVIILNLIMFQFLDWRHS